MSTGSARPTQQQQPQVRKPPFADWPTIKILTPPQGRHSRKTDEWCFSYCSQSVIGRTQNKEPSCRTICLRRVFPHEIMNVITFKTHPMVGPDGKAKYPLPAEGQPSNLPRYLGGKPADNSAPRRSGSNETTKYWDEGWYFWTSSNPMSMFLKNSTMRMNFAQQEKFKAKREEMQATWEEYQDSLNGLTQLGEGNEGSPVKLWAPNVPSHPLPDISPQSLLVSLPPDWPPLWDRINKLLAPSQHALSILHESITSGEQRQFASRLWEKAWSDEPFLLASRTLSKAYERWKERDEPDEDDGRKGST